MIIIKSKNKKYTISDVLEKQSVVSDEFEINQDELIHLALKSLDNLLSVLHEKNVISDKDVINIIRHNNIINIDGIEHE